MLISLSPFVLFIVNIWRRGWVLPVLAVGLWAFVAVVAGAIYPAFVQRFQVRADRVVEGAAATSPATSRPRATRLRPGERRRPATFDVDGELDGGRACATTPDTVRNIRLWDPAMHRRTTFAALQGIRSTSTRSTTSTSTATTLDGEPTQVMRRRPRPAAATASRRRRGRRSHLTYTHGYGVVAGAGQRQDRERAARPSSPRTCRSTTADGALEVNQPRGLLRRGPERLRHRQHRPQGDRLPGRGRRRPVHALRGRGRRRDRLDVPVRAQGGLRPALRRHQPADLGQHHSRTRRSCSSATSASGSRRSRRSSSFDADPYPVVLDGRIKYVARRLHDHAPLPERAAGRHRRPRPTAAASTPHVQLRAQLGEGRGRRLRRHRHFYVDRRRRPDHPGLPRRPSRSCSPTATRCPTALRGALPLPRGPVPVQTNMWGQVPRRPTPTTSTTATTQWNVAQDPGISRARGDRPRHDRAADGSRSAAERSLPVATCSCGFPVRGPSRSFILFGRSCRSSARATTPQKLHRVHGRPRATRPTTASSRPS